MRGVSRIDQHKDAQVVNSRYLPYVFLTKNHIRAERHLPLRLCLGPDRHSDLHFTCHDDADPVVSAF